MSGVVIGRGGEAGWCERSEPRCGAARGTCVSHNDLLSFIPLDSLLALGQVFLSFDPSQSGSLLPCDGSLVHVELHASIMPVSSDLVSHWLILVAAPRLLKPIWQGIKHLSSSCRTLLPLGLARSSSLPFVLLVYQLGPPLCLKLCFQLSPPSALPIPASASLVSSCRWEVGDVSTSNIGETVVSYQTMKYKFNYTPLVKFLNFPIGSKT